MDYVELLPPGIRNAFLNPDQNQIQIYIRTQDLGAAVYSPVFERLNQKLVKMENSQSIFRCLISDETHKLSSRKLISLGLDTELSGKECNIPNSIPKVLNFNGVHTCIAILFVDYQKN